MPGEDELIETGLFESDDFDAYSPEKWNSNMFTLGRRKVKGKLEGIGHALSQVLEESGLTLAAHLSDEFPSLWNKKLVKNQWLFFSRDEAAKSRLTDLVDRERTLADTLADPTPRYRQVFLGLSVDQDFLEVGLRLHHDAWVDRQNLVNLIKTEDGVARFKAVLNALPEHYEVSLAGAKTFPPPAVDEGVIEELTQTFEAEKQWFFIGARLPRDQVLILGNDVIDTAIEVFRDLVPVYNFCAWSETNDAISIDTLVAEREETIEARAKEFDREKAAREEALRKKQAKGQQLQAEIQAKIEETQAWRQREYAARRAAAAREAVSAKQASSREKAEAAAAKWGLGNSKDAPKKDKKERPERSQSFEKKDPAGSVTARSDKPRRESTPRKKPEASPFIPASNVGEKRAEEIVIGDLVEVVRGFLKRRRGVVQDIDEKGTLRVNFGALSSRLARGEVRGLGPLQAGRSKREGKKKDGGKTPRPA